MRIAIVALVISLAALGLGSFATFEAVNQDSALPPALQRWLWEAECADARLAPLSEADALATRECLLGHGCHGFSPMYQAILDNCTGPTFEP